MAFQILDTNMQPINIKKLDEEAAALWGKEVHPRKYAYPDDEIIQTKDNMKEYIDFLTRLSNWFDKIGYRIHSGTETWDGLRKEIMIHFSEFPEAEVMAYKPVGGYVALINHWEAKGYTPLAIPE